MRIWQLVSKMNWALYQCGSQELAGKIDLESYALMADFDFSSFSLIHLELKGNVFIRSRSLLTKPSLRSWWFKSVAVFGQELFNTLHPFWRHISPYVTYIGEYPLPANSLILNWSESNCWSESKLVINSTYKSTKSPPLKTFVSIFKNCKIYIC